MAYNDDALKTKLSTLNETQESIVSVSQWITFHRRHADRIAQVWHARLREVPPPKRLNFVYLVNDIVQNAKARRRPEFPNSFSPIIAEAVQQAYRSSTPDIQGKIRRVVDVWKSRGVFEESILQAIQARIDDVDKSKATSGKKTLMGNSLFSSTSSTGMPKELESLGPLQTAVTKADFTTKPLVDTATTEHAKINDPNTTRPSPPVYAASLSSLIKKLASAEAGLNESIAARKALLADLKRLIETNEAALAKDESQLADFSTKRTTAEIDKRDVEDSIIRGLAATPQEDEDNELSNDNRPDVEELTPEPEDFSQIPQQDSTPPRNSNLQGILAGFGSSTDSNPTVPVSPPLNYSTTTTTVTNTNGNGPSSSKKRKLSHDQYTLTNEASVPDLGEMGVTAFDGSNDMPQYTPSYQYNTTNYMPNFGTPAPEPDHISTLEQDVDALINASIPGGSTG